VVDRGVLHEIPESQERGTRAEHPQRRRSGTSAVIGGGENETAHIAGSAHEAMLDILADDGVLQRQHARLSVVFQ
jgi:hypothetical protein